MERALVFGAVAASLAVAGCGANDVLGPSGSGASTGDYVIGTTNHSLDVEGLTRTFILHVPVNRPMSTGNGAVLPYPLIIVLHGSSSSGADIEGTTNMDSLAEVNRSIVAYPDGIAGAGGLFPSDWNAGTCCGAAAREGIDDVGFIKALITEVSSKLSIDKTRIYVSGFSDGGRMAHRLACVMSEQIAAIGVVSGSLVDDACAPVKPVAVVAIHGTADDEVPYDDASATAPPNSVIAAAADMPPSIQFWISHDGCTVATPANLAASVHRTVFTKCNGADVVFYSIDGGTHTWPVLATGSAAPDAQLSASAVIASFFARHVRR